MANNQNLWGPSMWRSIHIIALNYPFNPTDEQRVACRQFFESLQYMLPCSVCQKNFKQKLIDNPIELASRKELFEWTVKIHNIVNGCLGKRDYPEREVLEIYEEYLNTPIYLTKEQEDAAKETGEYYTKVKRSTAVDCTSANAPTVEGFRIGPMTCTSAQMATIITVVLAIVVGLILMSRSRIRGR